MFVPDGSWGVAKPRPALSHSIGAASNEDPHYRCPGGRCDVRSQVFWVVDNGSSHRGDASVKRLSQAYANAILVHTPVHARWLNQVEIYFSLLQRKVLTPNDCVNCRTWN